MKRIWYFLLTALAMLAVMCIISMVQHKEELLAAVWKALLQVRNVGLYTVLVAVVLWVIVRILL